jgi:glycosyltransferase involved in cell wall biosynthesis
MKPRLLIIHNRFVIGGPALDTIPLAYHLKDDFDIHILYGCKEKDELEPWFLLERYKGLKLVKIESLQRSPNIFKDYQAYRFIRKYIRSFQPNIIHTHGAKAGLIGRLAAKKSKVPSVHTFHGHLFHSYFPLFVSKLLTELERYLAKHTSKIIAISSVQQEDLKSILIIPGGKIKVIPLGIDYIDCLNNTHFVQAFKRTYKIDPETICIGMLGRIVPIKNPIFFLEVAKHIIETNRGEDIRFFIVGDGTEKSKMLQFLKDQNLTYTETTEKAPFVFTSWVQNIQEILVGMDIVVLTSLNEGTPMSLIEAQMCAKPVVAVKVGGVQDTMQDTETGFLVDAHDVKKFAEVTIRLINNRSLRECMGRKGEVFAKNKFSKEQEVKAFKEVYNSLLNKTCIN